MGVIALLTLWPSQGSAGPGGLWCFGCGSIGTLDLINNILLFAPLGAALAAAGWGMGRAIAAGGLYSLAIEALQFFVVPGRDASPSDVLMNSVGTFVGWGLLVSRASWLRPAPAAARVWTVAAVSGWMAVLTATGWLLAPSVPADELFGQWAPRRPPFTQYRGQILSFDIAGHEVPHSPVPNPDAVRSVIAQRQAVAAVVTIPALPPEAPGAMIARLVAVDHEVILLAQRGDGLLGRFRLRSSDLRMRALSLLVPGTFTPNERVRIEAGYQGSTLVLRAVRPAGVITEELPWRVSLGWAFVRPAEIALGAWQRWVSGLWLAGLAVPLGFYAASATPAGDRLARWSQTLALAVVAGAVAAGLAGAPWLTGAAPSSWTDWAGAALGVLGGWLACRLLQAGWPAGASRAPGATAGPGRA